MHLYIFRNTQIMLEIMPIVSHPSFSKILD